MHRSGAGGCAAIDGSPALPSLVSERMRKRRAFADRELEDVMLQREQAAVEIQRSLATSASQPPPPPPPVKL